MNQYVVIIGMMALVLTSLTLIKSSIDDQQELQEINDVVSQNKITQMSESSGVSGVIGADSSEGIPRIISLFNLLFLQNTDTYSN